MQIDKNTAVTLDYRVIDQDGNLIDEGAHPLTYLHGGYSGIFPAIEAALAGKAVGDKLELKLQPAEAFGDFDAELIRIEPRSGFPEKIEVGMQFEGATAEGGDDMLYTITDIVDDKVIVDANHPLAGIALIFSCCVTDVRQASDEEINHGHTHDASCGHHH
jgi:FKBP-type peptidyl-prolyl cis-trans isomerase SlyD